MAEATAADYAWLDDHWWREAFCITLVRGLDEAGELSASFEAGYPQFVLATPTASFFLDGQDAALAAAVDQAAPAALRQAATTAPRQAVLVH